MKGFLDYIPGESVIHRLDPRTKLLLPLMICVGCFTCQSLYGLVFILALDILLGIVGGIFSQTMRLLKGLLKISIFLFLLQLLFIQHGNSLLALPFGLHITDDGLLTAAQVVLRLVGATLPLALMLSMTRLTDLTSALVCKCHLPYKYAFAITSAIRFIPAFSEDMQAIMEAQTARGVEFDTKNPFKKIGLVLPLCVPMLISSVEGIESAAIAAELRGFNLRRRENCLYDARFSVLDALVLLLGCAVIAAGIIL